MGATGSREGEHQPGWSERDLRGFADLWEALGPHHDAIWEKIIAAVGGGDERDLRRWAKETRELRRKALQEGDWAPFLAKLRERGAAYAEATAPFSDWLEVQAALRDSLVPLIEQTYRDCPDKLASALHGFGRFSETAAATLCTSYVAAKEEIISRQQETLRSSEERLAGIISSAMDAIITLDSRQRIVLFNRAAEITFRCPAGQAMGQALDRFLPAALREAHRQHVDEFGKTGVTSRSMGSPRILSAVRADGDAFLIEATISQVEAGGEKYYTVILRDITERRRAEQRLVTQQAVTRILAESQDIAVAATGILQSVCESLCWEVGAVWTPDPEQQVLRCAQLWHLPGRQAPNFEAESRRRVFMPGEGLPGRVWASGRPAWIPDVLQDGNFPRAPLAAGEGLHAAFAFPILLGSQVLGVMEFFSRAIQAPDEQLLRMMAAVGSQIGQFMERRRAEAEVRRQQAAIRELSTPVLQVRDRLLIVPMIGLIDAARARQMTEQLLAAVRRQRAGVVVIDITGVAAMDSAVANHLVNTVEAARLLGARVIVSGISTAIAGTLVQIGVDLGKLVTMGDLQRGIEEANRFLGVEVVSIDRKKAAPPAAAPGPRAPKPSAGSRQPEGKGSDSARGGETSLPRKRSA